VREWQHVALVWDNDVACSIYVDGYLIHKEDLTQLSVSDWFVPPSPSSWSLGRTYKSSHYGYFLGYLSDVVVFKRALSVTDIGQLMGEDRFSRYCCCCCS